MARTVRGTTERLLAIADIVEDGERWNQKEWTEIDASTSVIQTRHTCGSFGCVAGWAVTLTPRSEMRLDLQYEWEEAGSKALGIRYDRGNPWEGEGGPLWDWLFDGCLGQDLRPDVRRRRVAKVLRTLATIPEGKRDGSVVPRLQRILAKGR